MSSSLLQEREETSGLHIIFNTRIIPFDVGNISLLKDGDVLLTTEKLLLCLQFAVEFFMCGIIHADDVTEVVINGDNIHFVTDKSSLQSRCQYSQMGLCQHLLPGL